jgi:hypothetical protein
VDVNYASTNDEFYYFYLDGALAIDRSPAVSALSGCGVGACNVGVYTVSLLASEYYRFELQ